MLNNKFFNLQSHDSFFLGDKCHQQQADAVPVWAVTDLRGDILISNEATDENAWVVTGGRITINRMFQASTAMLLLSAQMVDVDEVYPRLPDNVARSVQGSKQKGPIRAKWENAEENPELEYPLDKNDEIAIWCGYIDRKRPVTKEDLVNDRLIRRFIGVIDTISCNGNATHAVTMIIQCRDRMKYLMDSIGTFNTSDFDPLAPGSASKFDVNNAESDGGNTVKRADIIIEIARRCIGHLGGSLSIQKLGGGLCDSVGGMRVHPGYISEYTQESDNNIDFQAVYDLSRMGSNYIGYRITKNDDVPFIGGKTTTQSIVIQPDLTFNIITGRLPYKVSGIDASTIGARQGITDRVPAEFIKFLSFQEPWPTEFFCDSRSGEYWYAPRGLDISGLVDPKRFYRTYFFRNAPPKALETIIASSKEFVASYVVTASNSSNTTTLTINDGSTISGSIIEAKRDTEQGIIFTVRAGEKQGLVLIDLLAGALDVEPPVYSTYEQVVINLFNEDNSKSGEDKQTRFKNWAEGILQQFNRTASSNTTPGTSIKHPEPSKFANNAVHSAQAALLYREESSAINWRSNIIVINQPAEGASGQSAVHLKMYPSWLKGRNFACSYFHAIDTTVGNNQAELVSVAMAYARNFSKELKCASLHIVGDPSIVPGEAVQVIGSPMNPDSLKSGTDRGTWEWDRKAVVGYSTAYRNLYTSMLNAHKTSDMGKGQLEQEAGSTPPNPNSVEPKLPDPNKVQTITDIELLAQAQLMCPATYGTPSKKPSSSNAKNTLASGNNIATEPAAQAEKQAQARTNEELNTIQFPDDPKSIWRVESVIDKFNEDQSGSGYRTELALLAPF